MDIAHPTGNLRRDNPSQIYLEATKLRGGCEVDFW